MAIALSDLIIKGVKGMYVCSVDTNLPKNSHMVQNQRLQINLFISEQHVLHKQGHGKNAVPTSPKQNNIMKDEEH